MKSTVLSCFILVVLGFSFLHKVSGIQCYQCSTSSDPKGSDNCGAYEKFHKDRHVSVECTSDESHTPGTFCVKVTKQGLRGFIWDGRWRNVIRRCGSVSDTGVTGVCNWGVEWNGVYWEECYCSEDNCNSSTNITPLSIITTTLCSLITMFILRN
ncbi:uncharacterized protein LOC114121341 [Aphis gossypii]|uniref:Protein sleepless n=1 Tax=Aphis gossypii TaxID=80765 RepID=A0A9P0J127_APHGO|nr:uncharacterized protein LOC114121341 [Aphis gossypii]CAH1723667.1 unnamed protein product [Aphis gossypii]